jgi:hypothetical protein
MRSVIDFRLTLSTAITRRLQYVSTLRAVEQPNCCVEGCRPQVHVPLRHRQILMAE